MSDYFDSKEVAREREAREQSELRKLRQAVRDCSAIIVREADGGSQAAEVLAGLVGLPTLRQRLASARRELKRREEMLDKAEAAAASARMDQQATADRVRELERLVGE